MPDYYKVQVGKFIFKVADDRLYSDEGVWIKLEDPYIRMGISDYLQQRSGDVAFVEIKPVGTELSSGEELAVFETIKVNISLTIPISGKIVEINPVIEVTPEVINLDPYGAGWLIVIEWQGSKPELKHLMDAAAYFSRIKGEIEKENSSK